MAKPLSYEEIEHLRKIVFDITVKYDDPSWYIRCLILNLDEAKAENERLAAWPTVVDQLTTRIAALEAAAQAVIESYNVAPGEFVGEEELAALAEVLERVEARSHE